MTFSRTYGVRSSEITPNYTLKEYYVGMYFQECFAEYAASRGVAAYDVSKDGLTWITSDVRIDFSGDAPFWREKIDMEVWVWKTTTARIYVDFFARRGGAEIARGSSIQLIADAKTHRPVRADKYAEKFDLREFSVFGGENLEKIGVSGTLTENSETFETAQAVRFDDLDFNLHLNNVKYVPRALESMPAGYRLSHKLISYRIKFLHEAFFNDTVVSTVSISGLECLHTLARKSDGVQLCLMKSLWKDL